MAIDSKYHNAISDGTSVNVKTENLKALVFNKENYVYFKNFLKKMKLVKYGNIDNYTESFMDVVKKINACLPKKDRLYERELS
ncbi:hypothetical protein A0H76_1439 [Hepatospora eriocheir]|uniref:Uncharacterized protein n=1 Tax=Hepatospora eriocheir TaxID=1081669 RepID=A0A1X0QH26_9MICR|nr:hypothetical protein A0H76_1439 [Hepatospora eriocheir]